MSEKYQDLVIKDGAFIGDFETMYQRFDDPWGQSDKLYSTSISRRAVCHFIEKYRIQSLVEFGCGLGTTTKYIHDQTGINIVGVDIAPTCIKKASKSYPHIEFFVDSVSNLANYRAFDAIFFSEITWYLLEDNAIDKAFQELSEQMRGKYFIHNLVFYKQDLQRYGKRYFTTLDEFVDFCPFRLISSVESSFEAESTIETSTLFLI